MRVAIYARVSTESQEARGTIGSQLEVLRKRVAAEGHELVAEYRDDGWSGARLDRPGLDALRDAAEAGRLDAVWCLSPDRLARMYAYQVIVLDELARHGVAVLFHDTPPLADDPQAQLLTQVQGVRRDGEERCRQGELALQAARYEAERVRRQYDAVDPANRLVAADLEQRWNARLAEVERLEAELTAAGGPTIMSPSTMKASAQIVASWCCTRPRHVLVSARPASSG